MQNKGNRFIIIILLKTTSVTEKKKYMKKKKQNFIYKRNATRNQHETKYLNTMITI